MSKKETKKPVIRRAALESPTGDSAMPIALQDFEEFFPDDFHDNPARKNSALAVILTGRLNPFHIVRIERIEIGPSKGWRITYRPPSPV